MQRIRPAAVALVVSAAAAAFAVTAGAAQTPFVVTLEYHVAPNVDGCPSDDDFRAGVIRQLGYDPFRTTAARRVAVRISSKQSGLDGLVRWSDARGRWVGDRKLSSQRAECGEIAANVAFAVAVQIQLLAALEPDKPPEPERRAADGASGSDSSSAASTRSSADSEGGSESHSKPSTDSASNASGRGTSATPGEADTGAKETGGGRTRPSENGFTLSAGLGPSVALGIAPHATAIGRLFASGRLDWFSLELAIDAALPATGAGAGGSQFSLSRYAASSAACGHVALFAGCLTATVGRLEARGLAVDRPATPAGTFTELGARIAARQDFGRYFAAVRVDGLVMTRGWTVMLNDTAAWTTPIFGGMVGLDIGVDIF